MCGMEKGGEGIRGSQPGKEEGRLWMYNCVFTARYSSPTLPIYSNFYCVHKSAKFQVSKHVNMAIMPLTLSKHYIPLTDDLDHL